MAPAKPANAALSTSVAKLDREQPHADDFRHLLVVADRLERIAEARARQQSVVAKVASASAAAIA